MQERRLKMRKIHLIAIRELNERAKSRSFLLMAALGPLFVLGLIYALFSLGGSEKQHWNVLIMDKTEIMDNKIASKKDPRFTFHFINEFVEYDQFAELEQFQEYDLAVLINEKIISNKQVIVSYRELPSENIQQRLVYHIERRFEEIMVKEFTDLEVSKFREIKQSMSFSFKNTYDPKNEISYKAAWVGYVFGIGILLFVFLFGMTILRGVANEKSNRVVEVLLASVSPRQLLTGKVIGIGITALLQFVLWTTVIAVGLYVFRQTFFPDLLDPTLLVEQMSQDVAQQALDEFALTARSYNDFVDLVYRDIHFTNMLIFFVLFFLGGYFFYGSFFAMIGAAMGSESDGQQYIIPISIVLILSLLSGYYVIYHPETMLAEILGYLPFTSPVIMMIELSKGFSEGTVWQIYLALFILFLSSIILFGVAGRIYKNGILQFGHRLRFGMFLRWLKKT
jgi:ABC-2 type transport system permease protein